MKGNKAGSANLTRVVKRRGGGEIMKEFIDEKGIVLEFGSEKAFDAALDLLYDREIPYMVVGEYTLVVPPGRDALFVDLKPKHIPSLSPDKLSPEEMAALRREYLSFRDDG
jgi:hypothetical protein